MKDAKTAEIISQGTYASKEGLHERYMELQGSEAVEAVCVRTIYSILGSIAGNPRMFQIRSAVESFFGLMT